MFHLEGPAVQVFQQAAVSGEVEGELIGIERLERAAVFPVVPFPAVLSVPQQGVAGGGELGPDLVGPAGEQVALHQGDPVLYL